MTFLGHTRKKEKKKIWRCSHYRTVWFDSGWNHCRKHPYIQHRQRRCQDYNGICQMISTKQRRITSIKLKFCRRRLWLWTKHYPETIKNKKWLILKLLICCIIHYEIQRKSITGNSILGENYKILHLLKYFIAGCLNLHVYGCYYRRKVIQTVSVICAGIQRTIPSSAVHVIGISFTGM